MHPVATPTTAMVRVTEELVLLPEHVTLYYASDALLGHLPVLIFYGPSTTANYTLNSSRIQVHVFSAAGFQSFPRITIRPNSTHYGVVDHLPRELQGDEVCRGLAFGLFMYFDELPDAVKNYLRRQYGSTGAWGRPGSAPSLFSEQHAADLAKAMVQAENTAEVIRSLEDALQTQHMSNVDMDLVLPPGSIMPLQTADLEEEPEHEDDILDPTLRQYGMYRPLVKLFGEPVFMPTSRLRRAPSKPRSLNRSKSLSKGQKLELRMRMRELVDTEERYILKLTELVKNMAEDFRQSARERPRGSISPSEEDLERLFPRSADQMLEVNTAFVQELRRMMKETEEDAMQDMERTFAEPSMGGGNRTKDPSGALAMARVFVEWFPKFTDCYQDYIRASQHFPSLLNSFLDKQSSFRQRVVTRGEQTMRSILIEPVQRLPRYSLLIDQIVSSLPMTHPALQLMLRARDIITNICSMDDPLPEKPQVTHRLRNMVESWPVDLEPRGRLVVAVDFAELPPPFGRLHDLTVAASSADRAGIFLLFADCIAVLEKKMVMTNNVVKPLMAARELVRELDKPSPAGLLASMANAAGGPDAQFELVFAGWHSLADVRFTESADGRLVWMASTAEMRGINAGTEPSWTSKAMALRCFLLREAYEGKAARWGEDVVRARIEGRFAEQEREGATWTLRAVRKQDNGLGMHAAIFQEDAEHLKQGRREPASIRVVLDNDGGTKVAPVGHYGVEVVIEMRSAHLARRFSMNTMGLNGKRFTDDVALANLLPTLSRRIMQLLSTQFGVANGRLAPALVSYYVKTLRSLGLASRTEKPRSFLSSSPVKMLSSFLGGASSAIVADNAPASPKYPRPPLGEAGKLFPSAMPRSMSSRDVLAQTLAASRRERGEERPENPLVRLEQTFTGYVASLQACKGHFADRTLRSRSAADELLVNDLYNRLILSPFDLDASAELPTEVVFAAFEKFVRIAWREQMGPVMTAQALEALQVRASKRVPGDFADFVHYLFADMAPQNRRAFTALIKLLADLLDGCGHDGDRGALTLAFAELLADHDNAHMYINLLDRLVEDCDRIFDDGGIGMGLQRGTSLSRRDSFSSMGQSHKSASGSMTSNTSSLRRKFGLDTLLRQNSRTEGLEQARPSMWRSLSKHSRTPVSGPASNEAAGLGKPSGSGSSVTRSKSVDTALHRSLQPPLSPSKMRRPGSRDRPPVAGAFDDICFRPASSHQLETIGEPSDGNEPMEPLPIRASKALSPRTLAKKRRSSLSDLRALMEATKVDSHDAAMGRTRVERQLPLRTKKAQTSERFNSPAQAPATPRTPSPSKIPQSPGSSQRLRSPRPELSGLAGLQKENVAGAVLGKKLASSTAPPPVPEKDKDQGKQEAIVIKAQTPVSSTDARRRHAKTLSTSNIPMFRPFSRTQAPPEKCGNKPGSTPTRRLSSPQRLKLQSPQRLRERLQTEKKAGEEVEAALKTELSKIATDMTKVGSASILSAGLNDQVGKLAAAVAALEEKLPRAMAAFETQQADFRRDMDSALYAAEQKAKAVDQLYREATAENELLYERLNEELGKILKAVKGKNGREDQEELIGKLKEATDETGRLRKENARLRREMVSLRAAVKGGQD